ncbi:RNase H-like domain found in reverse transcriptase [Popillia japonica]|uniref:RNase H-like domain found in reverse transcriptase n=1 Tax=Popillia japonica TaxID=7064 RepID=A0AAW1IFC1_POPJA
MYFKPKLNLQFEIFKFRQAKQESSENIDQFYARLLKLSKTCNFNKPEDEIKCQIILNTTNSGLRRYALNEQPDLEKLLTHARTMEQTDNHIKSMENTQVVNFTSKPQNKNKHKKVSLQVSNQKCKNCGNNWHSQGRQSCPAKDVTCFKCNRTGHFAKVCLSKAAETKRKGKQGILHITFSTEMTETKIIKDKFPELFQGTGKLKAFATRSNNTNAIRMCVDMRCANMAIKRVRHLTPTIDDIIVALNGSKFFSKLDLKDGYHQLGSKIFSKLDLKDGYHQLVLDKQSRGITSFSTHVGTHRYKRLNFGINAAAEIFQDTVRQVLVGIAGVINVSDDILVFGKSQEEHDVAFESVLERLKQSGLTLNERKCAFKKTSIHFLGFIFSDKGIVPDPKTVEAINNLDPPKNPSEVRSLLGMFNYVDAGPQGLGTILIQEKNGVTETVAYGSRSLTATEGILIQEKNGVTETVAYGSRSLTATEGRYSQIEKEMLAITWAMKHFHIYLFGVNFCLHTDHKAITWAMKHFHIYLFGVNFCLHTDHKPLRDYDYVYKHTHSQRITKKVQAKFVATHSIPKAMSLEDVERATKQDAELQKVLKALTTDDNTLWNDLKGYKNIKHEITSDNIQQQDSPHSVLFLTEMLEILSQQLYHTLDIVICKQNQTDKLTPAFNPLPYKQGEEQAQEPTGNKEGEEKAQEPTGQDQVIDTETRKIPARTSRNKICLF